jgi:hypothetical protein
MGSAGASSADVAVIVLFLLSSGEAIRSGESGVPSRKRTSLLKNGPRERGDCAAASMVSRSFSQEAEPP